MWMNLKRHFRDSLRNINNNKMSTAFNIIIIIILTLLSSAAFLTQLNSDKILQNVENKVRIQVFIAANANQEETDYLQSQIQKITNVKKVTYSSKKEQLQLLIRRNGKNGAAYKTTKAVPKNYSSAVFYVKIRDVYQLQKTTSQIKHLRYVDDVVDSASKIEQVLQTLNDVRHKILLITIITLIISFIILFAITKENIKSNQQLIYVQQLMGATAAYIKAPFIVTAIFNTVIGTLVSQIIIIPLYWVIYQHYNQPHNVFEFYAPGGILTLNYLIITGLILVFSICTTFLAIRIKEKTHSHTE